METHPADADSAETMMMVVEDVVEVVAEEAVVVIETASDATSQVTWLVTAQMRTRDLLGDPWSASSAMKMVIWPAIAQLVTVVAAAVAVVTTTTRDHAVTLMMEAIPGLKTEVEITTMTTAAEVAEVVAGVELPITTWTMLGARPTTTMLVMIGAVTVVIKEVESRTSIRGHRDGDHSEEGQLGKPKPGLARYTNQASLTQFITLTN